MGHRRHSQDLTAKHPKEGQSLGHRHHNFTVELFLDETGGASDIFIDHAQSGEKEKLTSWEPEKLIDFMARHTGLQSTQLPYEEPGGHRRQASKARTSDSLPEPSSAPVHAPPAIAPDGFSSTPRLLDLKVTSADSDNPNYVLREGQPFVVRLSLDPGGLAASRKVPLVYEASIIARQPGGRDRTVGEARRRIEVSRVTTINVASTGLPQGMYRLDALVRLSPAGAEHRHHAGATAYLEGELLEVY